MTIVAFNAAERYHGTWIIHRTAGAVSHRVVLEIAGTHIRSVCGLVFPYTEIEMAVGRGVDGCQRCLRYAQLKS